MKTRPVGNVGFERGTQGMLDENSCSSNLDQHFKRPGGTFDIPGKCPTRRWSLHLRLLNGFSPLCRYVVGCCFLLFF